MLGIALGRLVRRWFYTVPAHPIGSMHIISPVDLPLLTVQPPRCWAPLMVFLYQYQRHLSHRNESGLAALYPRSHLWAYLYFLYIWADYCGVRRAVLTHPDYSTIAELFICYVCHMDDYIDQFDSRELMRTHTRSILKLPYAKIANQEIYRRVSNMTISQSQKCAILRAIIGYRRRYLDAIQRQATPASRSIVAVIKDKEDVAGELWRTWADILGLAYRVPTEVRNKASWFMFNMGMFVQVIDDIADAAVDYHTRTQNLLLAVTQENATEWHHLQDYLQHYQHPFMSWRWIRDYIPTSYQTVLDLYAGYGRQLLSDTTNPDIGQEAYNTVNNILKLVY